MPPHTPAPFDQLKALSPSNGLTRHPSREGIQTRISEDPLYQEGCPQGGVWKNFRFL
jgi:hypothetical protein